MCCLSNWHSLIWLFNGHPLFTYPLWEKESKLISGLSIEEQDTIRTSHIMHFPYNINEGNTLSLQFSYFVTYMDAIIVHIGLLA